MTKTSNINVINHPLILDKLTRLRNKDTNKKDFKDNLSEIATLMVYEVFRNTPLEKISITTPIGETQGYTLTKKIVLCPILRAGLGMVEGIEHLLPNALIGHIGLYRNEDTLNPQEYYFKYPKNVPGIEDALVFVLDPMLATGGSAIAAIQKLKNENIKNIHLLAIVGTPVALERITKAHPDVLIYLAAQDNNLNEHGYIVPGLGDAGDRIFGTK